MGIQLAVTVDEDEKGRLEAIAASREETTADVLREAVTQYLEYDTWFRREVQKGIDSARRGELRDMEDVMQDIDKLITSYELKD